MPCPGIQHGDAAASRGSPGRRLPHVPPRWHSDDANQDGYATVAGDGKREDVLLAAGVDGAARVIVTVSVDATALLATLTCPTARSHVHLVAAVRASANADLLRDSGAEAVVVSAEAAGACW